MVAQTRRKTKKDKSEQINPFFFAACLLIEVYLVLLLCVYPFLIKAGYGVTSYVKYNFLIGISYGFFFGPLPVPTFIPIAILLAAVGTKRQIRDAGTGAMACFRSIKLSLTDKLVLLYILSLFLSSIVSANQQELLWGYPGWNMGLVSQFLFVCLFFILSRLFDPADLKFFTYAALAASSLVFVIGILQRLGMDVFNLYAGLENKRSYLSTIGQASWFSSYMVIFVMISVFLVWYTDKSGLLYKAGLASLVVGSMCLVTQNTDSAYAGLFMAISLLFVWSFDDTERMKRFLETALVILFSFRAAGMAYRIANEKAVKLDRLSVFMMQNPLIWLLIGALLLFYVLLLKLGNRKSGFQISRYRLIAKVYIGLLVLTILVLTIFIVQNTRGLLPETLSTDNNYLLFNRRWGNGRGAWLQDTVNAFFAEWKAEPLKALIGAGADQFYYVVHKYIPEQASAGVVLTNAHNEWLTAFLNFGLFGGTVYFCIFLSALFRSARNRQKEPRIMAIAVCIIAYMAHNLFCYQQYVCTPYIFAIMGVGERLLRSLDDSPVSGRS